tara:strand:+ start:383 stop:835 length:453 start_codon:yes stop_codon:yes gene_type:complete
MINKISIKTRFGYFSAYENNNKIFKVKFGKTKRTTKSAILRKFSKNLSNFLNKRENMRIINYKMQGNKIQKKIWRELIKIKPGTTKSYGQIGKKYNLSPRYIGKICGQNKLLIAVPCHRVIRSDGSLGGFSSTGGLKLKRKLLEFEKNWK